MKNIFLLLTFGLLLTTITSCKKEGCTDNNATNYNSDAKEDDESCTYLGDQYVSKYDVSEDCEPFVQQDYEIEILLYSADKSKISIYHLGNLEETNIIPIIADVNGNEITFSKTLSPYTLEGSGTINGNNLTLTYTLSEEGLGSIECIAECTKK